MTYTIASPSGPYEVVIGMEVHAQVISQSKLFSGASAAFGGDPNTHVAFLDAGMPGMLPVLNGVCVEQAIKTGLALNAEIHLESQFDRKNYFYPDLPTGYQISQFYHPLVGEGTLTLDLAEGITKDIGIERIHLEQDAGKSIHDMDPRHSYVDLNRAGVALMEIVSKPDMRSPEEAGAFLKKLRAILRTLGTCDGNMEEGSMRCDVNVSVRKAGAPLGTRCEIKNVNSVRFVMQAIVYEAKRQVDLLESGGAVDQETRLFDAATGTTRTMRSKEDAHDYRYFPDPDLLPLRLDAALVDRLRAELPELPDAKKKRFMDHYGLSGYEAGLITAEEESARYYEDILTHHNAPKLAANWLLGDVFGGLNKAGQTLASTPLTPAALAELLRMMEDGQLSGRMAKDVLAVMMERGVSAAVVVAEQGLSQISDTDALQTIIARIIDASPTQLADYRAGKDKLFGYFVGQVMKETGGKANPAVVNDLLKAALDSGHG
jgi:aspartyl-tRNA(Asn)/glutamyl-tRNA(Gln) amidotransferase subunit B